jgi:hypothetical protein
VERVVKDKINHAPSGELKKMLILSDRSIHGYFPSGLKGRQFPFHLLYDGGYVPYDP